MTQDELRTVLIRELRDCVDDGREERTAEWLLPFVRHFAAEELRSAAAWIPGPEEWHNGSETYDELLRRADELDPS